MRDSLLNFLLDKNVTPNNAWYDILADSDGLEDIANDRHKSYIMMYNIKNKNNMAYNNGYGGGGGYNRNNNGYGGGGGYNRNNNGYGGGGGYNRNNNGGQRAKKSGVTYSKIKQGQFEGLIIVNAWLKQKDVLVTFKVAPYGKTIKGGKADIVQSDSGKEYMKYICEVRYSNGNHRLIPVLYSLQTKRIAINELNLLITPNGLGVTSSGKKVTGSVVRLNG